MNFWPFADWRFAETYAVLARCGRHAFAWEWLRRLPAYRTAWEAARHDQFACSAAAFGLVRFEPPDYPVPEARPLWAAETDPCVLTVAASEVCRIGEPFDAGRFTSISTCHIGADNREHWLFSDGCRHIRFDVVSGSLRTGPAQLSYKLSGLASAQPCARTLLRLITLDRTGQLSPTLFPPERRAPRWVLTLRAHDAMMAGASHREIASELFGLGDLSRWRILAPSYRRRVQRLAKLAREAASIDPRRWLNGTYP